MFDDSIMFFGKGIESSLKSNLEGLFKKNEIVFFDIEGGSFADGESRILLSGKEKSVRGLDVFLFHSTAQPDTNLISLFITLDSLKRASAEKITVIIPYFGYARQDRKTQGREPISASCISRLIENSGAHRVVCIDLHAGQIPGFFTIPADDLKTAKLFAKRIKEDFCNKIDNLSIASPDAGGAKRVEEMSSLVNISSDFVICHKKRNGADNVKGFKIIGDIKGRDILIFDDITSTCSTLYKSAKAMLEAGAKSVSIAVVHFACTQDRCSKIKNEFDWSIIHKKYTTNSHPQSVIAQKELGFQIIDLSDLLFETVRRIIKHESVSSLF